MGWLLPTTLLEWTEPVNVRAAVEAADWGPCPWWLRQPSWVVASVFVAVWGCAGLSARYVGQPPPSWVELVGALSVTLFVLCTVRWLAPHMKRRIHITDKAVAFFCAGCTRFPYKRIRDCEIASIDTGGERIHLFVLRLGEHGLRMVGIDPAVSQSELHRLLSDRGIDVRIIKRQSLQAYVSECRARLPENAFSQAPRGGTPWS